VNDDTYARSQTALLENGDVIHPLRKDPQALALRVQFEREHETIKTITITRESL